VTEILEIAATSDPTRLLSAARDNAAVLGPGAADVAPGGAAAAAVSTRAELGLTAEPSHLQPLLPNQLWDWPTPPSDQTDASQLEFCDIVPGSCGGGSPFVPGGSFASNYRSFLEALKPNFALTRVAEAKDAIRQPGIPPSSGPTPRGWTKFTDASGHLQWSLAWWVSMMPSDLVSTVAKSALQSETVTLGTSNAAMQVTASTALDAPFATVAGGASAITSIELSANWLSVLVSPGRWADPGLIALARVSPSNALDAQYADGGAFFGREGMLSCRMVEFVVACDPIARVGLDPSFAAKNRATLVGAEAMRIGGIDFPNPGQVEIVGESAWLAVSIEGDRRPRIVAVVPGRP
jgi:hypothetical protein